MQQLLDLLKAQPSHEQLVQALREWTRESVLCKLSTRDAAVARVLVAEILPVYWEATEHGDELRALLAESLASLAGINALLLARDRLYSLQALQDVLKLDALVPLAVIQALQSTARDDQSSEGRLTGKALLVWSRYLSLVAGGQIVGQVAEILSRFEAEEARTVAWLAHRRLYSLYLSQQCLASLLAMDSKANDYAYGLLAEYVGRAVSLGEPHEIIHTLLEAGITSTAKLTKVSLLLQKCPQATKVQLYSAVLRFLQDKYLNVYIDRNTAASLARDADRIGGAAAVLSTITGNQFVAVYSDTLLLQSGRYCLSVRRAIMASFPRDSLRIIADECLARWADPTFIKHSSVVDQEALTETILVACANLSFADLAAVSKGKNLTEGISNHLGSTAERIRFLGMILAETISAQVIKDEKKRLTFGVPDTQTIEAQWWRALIELKDEPKDLSSLQAGLVDQPSETAPMTARTGEDDLKISELCEISDETSDEEFPTMRAPDSDDEDSDEDPTLVDREKLRPPVYIRDLIKMINNHDSYKHVSLALSVAPSLIRRKAQYGTELADYAINLAQIFAGIRDNFDMDDFQDMRQECLKALVVSSPTVVCPYLVQTFFTGDYSLQQKIMILSSIALGARELAGADEIASRFQHLSASKVLPPNILRQYQSIDTLAANMQAQILQPMAVEAAESVSGPAALKVHQVTRKMTTRPQQKMVQNNLTSIAAEHILFPLMGRFAIHAGKMIDPEATSFYENNLLAYYLRTLSLVYQVSSKSPALSRVTQEFWSLLLSLRMQSDHTVLEALLLSFLIIIDVNDNRRLAVEFSRQLVETQEWCETVFEGVAEEKIRVLAAGILIRIREIVEANQVLMMQSAAMLGNIGRGRFGLAGLK